jgi:hypothetical protein
MQSQAFIGLTDGRKIDLLLVMATHGKDYVRSLLRRMTKRRADEPGAPGCR